jgi:hypothetical protein
MGRTYRFIVGSASSTSMGPSSRTESPSPKSAVAGVGDFRFAIEAGELNLVRYYASITISAWRGTPF